MRTWVIGRSICCTVAALLSTSFISAAHAADLFFNVANGSYSEPGSWNPSGPPTLDDNAFIDNGGTATLSTGFGDANTLTLGSSTGQSGSLVVSGGDLQAFSSIRVGEVGTGTATVTGGAMRSVSGSSIFIGGQNSDGTGTLNLSGTGSVVRAADDFILGRAGTGTMDFQGGWLTGGYTVVGKFGTGLWNQSGGVYEQDFGDIEIGDGGKPEEASTGGPRIGTINLTGGVMQGAGHFAIGNRVGGGEVNISGGALALTGDVDNGAIIIGRGMNWEAEPAGSGGATTLRVIGNDATIIANGNLEMNLSNVASSSTLIAQITGTTHSTIKVAGNADIANGTFKVELNGYTPVSGDSWTIVEAGADLTADKEAITTLANSLVTATEYLDDGGMFHMDPIALGTVLGEFDAEDFSAAPLAAGLSWDVTYSTNQVVLSVIGTAAIPGDYDNNGKVENADYNLWKTNFGSTTMLDADGNGNLVVDAADYTIWRDHLGNSAGAGLVAGSAVPEPTSVLLVIVGVIAAGFLRVAPAGNGR